MITYKIATLISILVLTLFSGLADSRGFIYASQAWENGKLIWAEAGKTLLVFGLGIVFYLFAIKYMQQAGLKSAEIQTLIWFVAVIIGVAVASGKFSHWNLIDQIISVAILTGIGLLIFRTGG